MPKHPREARIGLILLLATLTLQLFIGPFFPGSTPVRAESSATTNVALRVSWDAIEGDHPQELIFTIVPDGIAFMALTVHLSDANNWETSATIAAGTQAMQFRGVDVEGLDYRVLGSVKDGYTIEFYPEGEIPTDNAHLANQDVDPNSVEIAAVPTQTVIVEKPSVPMIETQPGESLSDEEYQQRLIRAQLEANGLLPNRTPYYIGIAICVVLIIVVIIIRILLGRSNAANFPRENRSRSAQGASPQGQSRNGRSGK